MHLAELASRVGPIVGFLLGITIVAVNWWTFALRGLILVPILLLTAVSALYRVYG